MLFAGRAVSIVSTLLTAFMIGVLGARAAPPSASRNERILAGAGGALAWFCFLPVLYWARLMRVDMLAELLSIVGFWLGLKAFQRPALIYAAALCFVGAVFTKQSAIAAPAALFALTSWLRPRLAIELVSVCLALGLATLGLLEWATGGEFLRHIVLYNINRINLANLKWISFTLRSHQLLFLGALILAFLRTDDLRKRAVGRSWRSFLVEPCDVAWLGLLFYFATTTLMLGAIAKSGASLNYLLESLMVICVLIGGGLAYATRFVLTPPSDARPDARQALGVIIAPLLLALQAPWTLTPDIRPDREPALERLSERVRGAAKPIISDDMVMLLRSGKPVVWEPAIFAELANEGVWDESPFIQRIMKKEFAMFITENTRGSAIYDSRYNPAVADAIDAAYPVLEKLDDYTLHLPPPDPAIPTIEK